jgi:carbon-monoxide dehydrogenase medium subunit
MELHYEAPASVDDAVRLLADAPAGTARVLAGGTDLLVQMRTGRVEPSLVVDVKHIPETLAVGDDGDCMVIGAALDSFRLHLHPEFAERFPGLAEAAGLIGSDQIQGRASIGGNLCNASPAADTVPALIALGAVAEVAGPSGTRRVPVAEFTTGPGTNALEPGEFLVSLRVPLPAPRSADAYLRLIPRSEMDIAVVGSAVALTLDADGTCTTARVVLGAVAPTAIEVPDAAAALVGSGLDDAALGRAGEAASAACSPIDDLRGTIDYRRKIAAVLTRRAASIATERASARGAN